MVFKEVAAKLNNRFKGPSKADRLKGAFFAGSIMPDIGNYPGGEKRLSDLSHNLRTWDLAGRLLSLARDPYELAFSYGWVLHVVTDIIGHARFTNITHAEICGLKERFPQGVEAYDYPLDHKKTEFGASAYLLGVEEYAFLWDPHLYFPEAMENRSLSSHLETAFSQIYAFKPDKAMLISGIKGIKREIRRMPVVMRFLGSVRGRPEDLLERAISILLRCFFVPLYTPILKKKGRDGAIAVISPFRLCTEHTARLREVNEDIIRKFTASLGEDFKGMENLALYFRNVL